MSGKAQAARQPSIDELLASIRQAIHARVAPPCKDRSPSVVHTAPPDRPETGPKPGTAARRFQAASHGVEALKRLADDLPAVTRRDGGAEAAGSRMTRTLVTTGQQGFAGLLGGDVRLEEALARLNQPGWRGSGEAPRASETASKAGPPDPAPAARPGLRPSIDDWTGGGPAPDAADASPAPAAAAPSAGAGRQGGEADQAPPRRSGHRSEPAPAAGDRTRAAPGRNDELWEEDPMYDERHGAPRLSARPTPVSASAKPTDLLSSEAASAASSAFNRLADAIVTRSSGGERSLDEITREVLRPLLKNWLDENLPGLVERLVREEIERVARPGK